jgi:predicted aspartyl protease
MFAEVTFRLIGGDNPLILIPATVNERGPYAFILDTGAGTSLVSQRLARDLDLVSTGKREGAGAAGRVQVELATLDALAIGGARRAPMPIAITAEVERIGAAIGAPIDGDLGYDFLRDFRVTVDYAKQLVRLVQGPIEVVGAGPLTRSEIPFTLAAPLKPLVLVPVFVDGQGPFTFAVDTGASMTTLSPELAGRLDLAAEGASSMTGAGGVIEATFARVRSLAIGGASLENLGVMVSDFLGPLGNVLGTTLDGIVGYNFLRRHRVTFDYPAGVLCLVRAA